MNIIEHIHKVVDQLQEISTVPKSRHKFIYVNKGDESDTFTTIDEALERQLNLADYKKVSLFDFQKDSVIRIITDSKATEITSMDIFTIELFLQYCKTFSTKEDFQRDLKSINAKIFKAKDPKKLEELKVERVYLYIRHDIKPQKSFADLDLYNKLHKEYVEKVNEKIDKI